MTDREKEIKQGEADLLFYLRNYNELTKSRPRYKQVVDREINEIVEKLKALSR